MREARDPLTWFGLDRDASVRDLKRAYALRLKTTRPDVDPEGFQQLHGAYQAALAMLEFIAVRAEAPARAPAPQPVARPIAPVFDFEAFYRDVIAVGAPRDADATSMRSFLLGNEALWALDLKRAVSQALIRRLWEQKPGMSPSAFDGLAGFFDEWAVDRGRDDFGIVKLRGEFERQFFGFTFTKPPPNAQEKYGEGRMGLIAIIVMMLLAYVSFAGLSNQRSELPPMRLTPADKLRPKPFVVRGPNPYGERGKEWWLACPTGQVDCTPPPSAKPPQ